MNLRQVSRFLSLLSSSQVGFFGYFMKLSWLSCIIIVCCVFVYESGVSAISEGQIPSIHFHARSRKRLQPFCGVDPGEEGMAVYPWPTEFCRYRRRLRAALKVDAAVKGHGQRLKTTSEVTLPDRLKPAYPRPGLSVPQLWKYIAKIKKISHQHSWLNTRNLKILKLLSYTVDSCC